MRCRSERDQLQLVLFRQRAVHRPLPPAVHEFRHFVILLGNSLPPLYAPMLCTRLLFRVQRLLQKSVCWQGIVLVVPWCVSGSRMMQMPATTRQAVNIGCAVASVCIGHHNGVFDSKRTTSTPLGDRVIQEHARHHLCISCKWQCTRRILKIVTFHAPQHTNSRLGVIQINETDCSHQVALHIYVQVWGVASWGLLRTVWGL